MGLFDRKEKYIRINPTVLYVMGLITAPEVPDETFANVLGCEQAIYQRDLDKLKFVQIVLIPSVFPLKDALLDLTVDEGSFQELFTGIKTKNPLNFPGYMEKLAATKEKLVLMKLS